jgi:hypothetical protein
MNRFLLAYLLCFGQVENPQIETGTVIFVDVSTDELTIAADSRSNLADTGQHSDARCKISALGDKFVFTAAGMSFYRDDKGEAWDIHTIAREIWRKESSFETKAVNLVNNVSEQFVIQMELIYRRPEIIAATKKYQSGGDPVLVSALFAATDKFGALAIRALNIDYDDKLFNSSGEVRLVHNFTTLQPEKHGGAKSMGMGHDEVIEEFLSMKSARSRDFMGRFLPQLTAMSPSEKRAAFASALIEQSILLHPQRDQMGFPIDVLQLERTTGVRWISVKPNCPKD